jgi:hypothetical protein
MWSSNPSCITLLLVSHIRIVVSECTLLCLLPTMLFMVLSWKTVASFSDKLAITFIRTIVLAPLYKKLYVPTIVYHATSAFFKDEHLCLM